MSYQNQFPQFRLHLGLGAHEEELEIVLVWANRIAEHVFVGKSLDGAGSGTNLVAAGLLKEGN